MRKMQSRSTSYVRHLLKNGIYAPFSLSIDITDQCNFRCCHCYTKHIFGKYNNMDLKKIEEIMIQGKAIGTTDVCFTGGEVFVRKDFFDILILARDIGLRTIIKTNAYFLSEEILKKLEAVGLSEMQISIYGMNDEEYALVTGTREKDISQRIRDISALQSSVHKLIRYVVLKENYTSMNKYIQWCKDSNIPELDYFHIMDISPASDGNVSVMDHGLSAKELRIFYHAMKKEHPDYFDFICNDIRPYSHCVVGKTGLNIDCAGDVSPCAGFSILLGNIYEKDIASIWRDSKKLKEVQKITKEDFICKDCLYRNHCSNRCIGTFFQLNNREGYITPHSDYCESQKAKAEILSFVINNG